MLVCAPIDIGQCRAIAGVTDKVVSTHCTYIYIHMYVGTEVQYVGTSSASVRTKAFDGLPTDNHCILL